jgi:hypothetical protein
MPVTIDGVEVSEGMTLYMPKIGSDAPCTMVYRDGQVHWCGQGRWDQMPSAYKPEECYASLDEATRAQAEKLRNFKIRGLRDSIRLHEGEKQWHQVRIDKAQSQLDLLLREA